MIPVSWPVGISRKLIRDGYTREPQEIVRRQKPEAGPSIRYLVAGSAGQRVKGFLSLTASQMDDFRAWHEDTLDRGRARFDWTITDIGEDVIARLAAQPIYSRAGAKWRVALDLECAAPVASLAQLTALADLEDEPAGVWPEAVRFHPKRRDWSSQPGDGVIRSDPAGPQRQALVTRSEGAVWPITLHLSPEELLIFEGWFRAQAAFGARDILFPDLEGGQWLGSFHEIYSVTPAPQTAEWSVKFKLYMEAVR